MAKNLTFNFNTLQKAYLLTELKDGQKVHLAMPKLNTFKKIAALQKMKADDEQDVEEVMYTLAGIMADCLTNNIEGVKVRADQVANDYDIGEIMTFIAEYYEKFVGGIKNNPN